MKRNPPSRSSAHSAKLAPIPQDSIKNKDLINSNVMTPAMAAHTGDDSLFAQADQKFNEDRHKFTKGQPKTSSSSFLIKHDSQSLLPPNLMRKGAQKKLPT